MLQLYDNDDTKRARGGGSEKAVASVVVWHRDEMRSSGVKKIKRR